MSLFGEIVIPSSRALWDEDLDEITAEEKIPLVWDSEITVPSDKIETLVIVESSKLNNLAKICLLDTKEPICKIAKARVEIHKNSKNEYIVLYEENEFATAGEITDILIPWIEKSKRIITFNSLPAVTFQSNSREERPSCFIRKLSTGEVGDQLAPKLEAPNLATGLTAGVLSYCHHIGLPASLFICYLEPRPLDSISAEPILNILKKLKIPIVQSYKVKISNADSNLYM